MNSTMFPSQATEQTIIISEAARLCWNICDCAQMGMSLSELAFLTLRTHSLYCSHIVLRFF